MTAERRTSPTATIQVRTWLDAALREHGLMGKWLAERLGVDPALITRFRRGMVPSAEQQQQIIEALAKETGRTYSAEELGW